MDTTKIARVLAILYVNLQNAERPIDKKTAKAEFEGACKAATAMGLGFTKDHVHLTVMEARTAHIAEQGERPPFRPVNNFVQQDWDHALYKRTAEALVDILS